MSQDALKAEHVPTVAQVASGEGVSKGVERTPDIMDVQLGAEELKGPQGVSLDQFVPRPGVEQKAPKLGLVALSESDEVRAKRQGEGHHPPLRPLAAFDRKEELVEVDVRLPIQAQCFIDAEPCVKDHQGDGLGTAAPSSKWA